MELSFGKIKDGDLLIPLGFLLLLDHLVNHLGGFSREPFVATLLADEGRNILELVEFVPTPGVGVGNGRGEKRSATDRTPFGFAFHFCGHRSALKWRSRNCLGVTIGIRSNSSRSKR